MNSDLRNYWNAFYAGARSKDVPEEPSAFAPWARERIKPGATIWEFGFGTARDALWFASKGYAVRGFDFAESAIGRARQLSARRELPAQFDLLDLSDPEQVTRLTDDARRQSGQVNIYGRFLIHSLTNEARTNLFDVAAAAVGDGHLLLEFRTGEDAKSTHLFGDDHFRQYLDPDLVVKELEARGGTVVERVEGHGLAVYKTEDPHVSRLVATWPK